MAAINPGKRLSISEQRDVLCISNSYSSASFRYRKKFRCRSPTLPSPPLVPCGLIHLPTGLPELNEACYFPRMSTLAEIEAAVDRLPQPEQEILLEHLARKLGARPPVTEGAQRERWLQKLDRLRNRGSTGKTGVPLQEILDDIRGERS